ERRRLLRRHERALGYERAADAARDRRQHLAVDDVDSRALDLGLRGRDVRFRGAEARDRVVIGLLAHEIVLAQRPVPVLKQLGFLAIRLRALQRGFGRAQSGAVARGVDLIELLADAHVAAFREQALLDDARDLRPDLGDAIRDRAAGQLVDDADAARR